jgi:hypothetical protein
LKQESINKWHKSVAILGRLPEAQIMARKTLAARERNEDVLYDKRGNTYRGRQSVTGPNRQLSAFNKSFHRIILLNFALGSDRQGLQRCHSWAAIFGFASNSSRKMSRSR